MLLWEQDVFSYIVLFNPHNKLTRADIWQSYLCQISCKVPDILQSCCTRSYIYLKVNCWLEPGDSHSDSCFCTTFFLTLHCFPAWLCSNLLKKSRVMGLPLVVQWLRLRTPDARGLGLIPGQGTRSHMLQLKGHMWHNEDGKSSMLQLRPGAAKLINYFKKRERNPVSGNRTVCHTTEDRVNWKGEERWPDVKNP